MKLGFKFFISNRNVNHLLTRYFSSSGTFSFSNVCELSLLVSNGKFSHVCIPLAMNLSTSKTKKMNCYQEHINRLVKNIMENTGTHSDVFNTIKANGNSDRQKFQSSMNSGTMAAKSTYLVFLYGTLKEGEPNHGILKNPENGSAKYICKARTQKKWPLVIASRYNIPYLLFNQGIGKHVIGEIYEVDDRMLTQLDALECHPKYYERVVEDVEFIDPISREENKCSSWIYFLKSFRPVLLELPYLENYSSCGDHGLPYVASEDTSDTEEIYS